MYKRVIPILLLAALLLCGAGTAGQSAILSVSVVDTSNNNTPLEGATVIMDNLSTSEYVKQLTDGTGIAKFQTSVNDRIKISVSAEGYNDDTKTLEPIDYTYPVTEFYLTKKTPVTLTVRDTSGALVSNAEVSINGIKTGSTSTIGTLPLYINKADTYTIEISHPLYEHYSEQISIGAETTIPVTLTKIIVSPFFYITTKEGTPIEGASIYLNGSLAGITNEEGIATLSSTSYEGNNAITVTRTGYESFSDNVYISSGQTEYDVRLSPLTHALKLQITSKGTAVAGAVIYIDEKLAAYSDAAGTAIPASEYTEGDHILLVTSENYSPVQKTINVTPENTTIFVDLARTTMPVTMKVSTGDKVLSNVPVCIDGKMEGITDADGLFTATYEIGRTIQVSAILEGYTGKIISHTVGNEENKVDIVLSPDVPVTMIAITALGIIVILLVVILIVTGIRKREAAKKRNRKNSSRNSGRRDFL